MKQIIAVILIIGLFCFTINAEPIQDNFADIKGDYKIFCLDDTFDIARKKAEYLEENKEISNLMLFDGSIQFDCWVFNHEMVGCLWFAGRRLYDIRLDSREDYTFKNYQTAKDIINGNFLPKFKKIYGHPDKINNFPYIGDIKIEKFYDIAQWKRGKKVISIGLMGISDGICHVSINIEDNEIFKKNINSYDFN